MYVQGEDVSDCCFVFQAEDGIFFFQAEDGIRDIGVTGVQTCALPISIRVRCIFVSLDYTKGN